MSVGAAGRRWTLAPLGALYGLAAWSRRSAYERGWLPQARLRGRVISVGNLTVGGSGKTPVTALIAATLRDAGQRVAVLSRGYRGSFAGEALVVSDGARVFADAATAGDEPVLLARELPGVIVAVGRRRDRVGRRVEEQFGVGVHVLDDGFQHLRLARDLDVVCVAPEDLVDLPLPAGRLREFAGSGGRAQVVLVSGGDAAVGAARSVFRAARVFAVERHVVGFVDRNGQACAAPQRPFAFCGIARPERFLDDLSAQVRELRGRRLFRDHHAYSASDMAGVVREAEAAGADALVTTSKDAVRLPAVDLAPALCILKISVRVTPEDEFRDVLLRVAREGSVS